MFVFIRNIFIDYKPCSFKITSEKAAWLCIYYLKQIACHSSKYFDCLTELYQHEKKTVFCKVSHPRVRLMLWVPFQELVKVISICVITWYSITIRMRWPENCRKFVKSTIFGQQLLMRKRKWLFNFSHNFQNDHFIFCVIQSMCGNPCNLKIIDVLIKSLKISRSSKWVKRAMKHDLSAKFFCRHELI